MNHNYIEIDKTNLMLGLAWVAAIFAYYAYIEASRAHNAAVSNRDPITVEPAADEEDADGDADE